MPFFYFDPGYLLLMIVTLVISGGAQLFVRSAYSRWSQVRNGVNASGPQIAERLMRTAGLTDVGLEATPGHLTDHYDPSTNVVRMSEGVAGEPSVASMAIIAHELGHAQQYQERSVLIGMRSFLLPAVRFSPSLSYMLILAGLFFQVSGLLWAGILFFGVTVVFMVLTLPVEIDASRRGLKMLQDSGLMTTEEDATGARSVLTAAAMTYIAAAITSVLTLLYYISLAQNDR